MVVGGVLAGAGAAVCDNSAILSAVSAAEKSSALLAKSISIAACDCGFVFLTAAGAGEVSVVVHI